MGFNKLFWGFIFLFDFRIGGIDILPDIIGYILFYQGLSILEEKNEYFGKAKKFAFPMIFLAIFDIYQPQINEIGGNPLGVIGILMGITSLILGIMMVYNICNGIANEARLTNNHQLESQANNRWHLYLINNIIIIAGIIIPMIIGVFFIVIIIFSLVTYVLMLGLMKTASHTLE
ncbi:hypothetical protein [Vallitalea guaymasensis]|uniref:hypothetical protein n=1 Tax=Vallitalea guaymasensis TaxID=1185412 RepID=UPI000DE3CADB|nr:hypothetical protein [Vallitalea guaymasensis]